MRSLLFIFAALVSLIYAADPVGTYKSGCLGPMPVEVPGLPVPIDLYALETVTLSDGKQFEKEQVLYTDSVCEGQKFLMGRIQGTFETDGAASPVFAYPSMDPVTTAIKINVQRTHYFVTPLFDSVPNLLLACGISSTVNVTIDVHTLDCEAFGIVGNNSCPTFQDIYNVDGDDLQFGLQFLNSTTCTSRQMLLNAQSYTPLAAPTLASGKYELGCTEFNHAMGLYNTYLLEITATTGTTGKYSLTSNTFQGATCAQNVLFSTTVLSATYAVDGYAVVQNNMLDGKRPMQLNLVFTSKKVTPSTSSAAIQVGAICSPTTFTAGQATELNTVGCIGLNFPPSSDACASKHFDVIQEKLDGSGVYPGGATGFKDNCSADKRVEIVSSNDWTTYVEPTPTVTPSPTSSSSSLAANVLLLISLLVFVLHF